MGAGGRGTGNVTVRAGRGSSGGPRWADAAPPPRRAASPRHRSPWSRASRHIAQRAACRTGVISRDIVAGS